MVIDRNTIHIYGSLRIVDMITNKDLKFIKISKELSNLSDFKQTHIGCCIVHKGSIISTGYNSEKSNPLQKRYNVFRNFENQERIMHKEHGEIAALSKLPWFVYENEFNLKRATIYVFRQHKNTHTYAMSLPCPACMAAIKESGIGRIAYTIENGIAEMKLA